MNYSAGAVITHYGIEKKKAETAHLYASRRLVYAFGMVCSIIGIFAVVIIDATGSCSIL